MSAGRLHSSSLPMELLRLRKDRRSNHGGPSSKGEQAKKGDGQKFPMARTLILFRSDNT